MSLIIAGATVGLNFHLWLVADTLMGISGVLALAQFAQRFGRPGSHG